ncbi:helix-turn-helix transcriptional regulator [Psychrobium sp. nBUS_13]|uniref:helix-turn-helix transcriptional regulator n=1 Tax=Psychrobium sp. nBUS_13 TaxID=3395319 RepID=UPI003EB740F2
MSPSLQRFHFIEVMITWHGYVNTTHLTRFFNIQRQAASRTFGNYKKQHPSAILYDESVKGFVPDSHFKCRYSAQQFSEYQLLTKKQTPLAMAGIIDIPLPTRNPNPKLAQPILRAIEDTRAIDIGYTSLSNPQYSDRIIEPHSLIFDGMRWHVRAYCQQNGDYRDFVLSRFNGEASDEAKATHCIADDEKWHQFLDIEIIPDPRLTQAQQDVIALDYQMKNAKCVITTRVPLINYLLKRLRLDTYATNPLAQQIVLSEHSRQQIAPYTY